MMPGFGARCRRGLHNADSDREVQTRTTKAGVISNPLTISSLTVSARMARKASRYIDMVDNQAVACHARAGPHIPHTQTFARLLLFLSFQADEYGGI